MNLPTRRPSDAQVTEMAVQLLNKGMHPKRVREALAKYGIRWEYSYLPSSSGPIGMKERLRRLKQSGQDICTCGSAKAIGAPLCFSCLEKKWSPTAAPVAQP